MGSLRAERFHSVFLARRVRASALATAGAAALCLMTQFAAAQEQAEVAQADNGVEAVSVTGTRIVRDGYSAPTPVTVVGAEQIAAQAPANLADFVNSSLPSVIGSETSNNSSGSLSNGLAGINALNLRSLGVNRTLILLDGHRTPASAATGDTDINTIPQQLVKRVDVVTGGASADYGSDAVGGVVNFILDKEFSGFKSSFEYGETDAGLQPSYKVNGTYGMEFGGGRGHALISGEWVQTAPTPKDYNPAWNKSGFFRVQNPAYTATNGQPFYLIQSGIGASQVTPGGLVINSTTVPAPGKAAGVTSTAFAGTYFGLNATIKNLAYGTTTGPWMIGGDTAVTQDNYGGTNSLAAGEQRQSVYARGSYYVTPDIEVWAEGSLSRYKGFSIYQQPPQVGGITIRADNAFLPASIRTAMAAQGIASLNMGSTNSGFPESGSLNGREAWRFAGGADGTFDLLTEWKWDVFGQVGWVNTREQETPVWNNARLAQAQDAVFAPAGNAIGVPAGTIVCRSTLTNPTDGCAPLSRIGVNGGTQSPSAFQSGLNYVLDTPFRTQRLSEQVYGFNVSGNPLENWEGPISVAFGAEWRLESINGFVPPKFNSGWLFGNYLVNRGHYSVAETYLETVVPILPGMDFNGAYRYTAYSTSGGVSTWKTGLTYQVIDDLKLRVTYSHDIRAPNLNELFAAGTARTNTVAVNNQSLTFVQNQTGNPNLNPEAANSLGAGVVITPTIVPGLALSVDYYNITIAHAIGSISAQNTADLCFVNGFQPYCTNITYADGTTAGPTYNGKTISTILLVPFNFSKQKAEGIDFDATYQVPLEKMDWFGKIPGELTLHALATHYMRNYSNDGVNAPTDQAGVNSGGGTPSWVYRFSGTYHTDPWTFYVLGRGISAGKYSNEWVVCSTGCPASTLAHRTANYNHIDGNFYLDTSISYDFESFGADSQVFLSVKNLFNTDPALVASGPDGNNIPAYPNTNRNLFDYLGRVYRIGLRLRM
jgi:outer membrane receptor protein involved in Fe transport